ncbi:hypothetical protein [Micromonospora mirobrigensis]|uniref:Uncharacterized protein n=1 Tax=Micromonospora mirobrigensis TaxID=262898 RepID=A0A1C4VJX1_9ACTN|nr:hypothetical protein [Micromonospora mirobrigensis]SCE84256.1 hypothetical protein GA0070564_1011262 [Micromonospora mirobrigensis]
MGKRNRNRHLRDAAVPPQVESALVKPVAELAHPPRVRREYHVGDEQRPKHREKDRNLAMGSASRAPANGQAALDRSVQIKSTNERRRIGVDHDTGEIVILDRHRRIEPQNPGGDVVEIYHGHVRDWNDTSADGLNDDMRNALKRGGLVDKKGRPTPPPKDTE